ncbi:MAG: ABC transporter permease, partial [Clostridiales bacterium]|nr:ABC transporter permease [Clostridiales bacterium]
MKTISRIAYSNDKKNKTRSILIMMSICLTTMLLVIISTVGNGMIRLQKSQAAGSYGSNYGLFVAADTSQLKEVSRRAEIDAIGIMCTEGIIKGNENGGFVCMDETARKMLPYNKEYELKEGKYPEKMQEIAAGRAFFRAMGYDDVKVGDTVTLDYRAGMRSEYKPEEFVVSGILYDRDEYTIEASYVAFGSQEFYDEHVAENDRQYNIYFTLNDSGATKKQMKQLIFREGMFLTISSIPVGLLLGFLIAKCGFNWLVEQGNLVSTQTGSMGVQNQQVPLFSLPVILLCIFVSFLTVALALRKPMKIVSRISPIEATRYLENAETHKKGKRNGRKNVTVFSMAMANITGNPKRTIGTILTLGLSCALFVI